MTERQWLAGSESWPLLEYCIGDVSKRKLRLFAVACCHRIRKALYDPHAWKAVEVTEQFADGAVGSKQPAAARRGASAAGKPPADNDIEALAIGIVVDVAHVEPYGPAGAATRAADVAAHITVYGCPDTGLDATAATQAAYAAEQRTERAAQAALLRDVVRNPFRKVKFDRKWCTSDVTLLARGIYEEKAFDRMPILADALQDAGCDNAKLLDHLRDAKQTHVRGCWALDLVLGKE